MLASASPRRHMLLGLLGVAFETVPSAVDESGLDAPTPEEFARVAAREKCLEVAARIGDGAVVLGADTVVHFGGEDGWHGDLGDETLLGKPSDREEAREMLRRLSGRVHRVTTAVSIARPGADLEVASRTSRVRFHPLSGRDIDAYVATGESLDKAGAYAVQGRGGRFIARVEGDLQNVIGLPLRLVVEMLSKDYTGLAMPSEEVLEQACGWTER